MPETIIITGAAGFIGSSLARVLLAAWSDLQIFGIDNFDPFYDRALKERNIADLPADRFELAEIDICDRNAVIACMNRVRPSAIFHIAALAGVRPSIEKPGLYIQVNVNGTVNILDAAHECGCRDVLLASSSSVYGNRAADDRAFSEDDDISKPYSPYAATKCACEAICTPFANHFDLRIGIIRFFTVYGPAQRPDLAISKFMRLIANDQPIPMFGDGASARDYTYIDDITRGLVAAHEHVRAQPGGFCRVWNLGNSSPILLKDLIELIERTVGKKARIEQYDMQPGDVIRTYADLTRVQRELGWKPEVELADGLAQQWNWQKPLLAAGGTVSPSRVTGDLVHPSIIKTKQRN